ncbi:MAG: hypothetical protein J6V68_02820 [Clostridia bacterium]|nr:hypothetical protein [Clostridia bacterium]
MANKKTTKRAILASVIAMVLCLAMFVGTTYAWFTDSVTSTGNKIVAGTLKIDLELYDVETDSFNSIKDTQAPIFNYDNWEPTYTDVKVLKIDNEGSLALKWYAKFVSDYELSALANVIQVYVNPTDAFEYPAERNDIYSWQHVGTVKDFVNTIETTTYGVLAAGESKYLGIALVMDAEAGNEYQGMSLAGNFDILILATQVTAETDIFDDQYDKDAEFDEFVVRNVSTEAQLADVLSDTTKESPVVVNLKSDITVNTTINVVGDVTINMAQSTMEAATATVNRAFVVTDNSSLTINNMANTDPIVVGNWGLAKLSGATNAKITLNGGNYVANTVNGSFISAQGNCSNVDITLNNVTYTDLSNDGYALYVTTPNVANVIVNGGTYTAQYGFAYAATGLASFNGVTVVSNGFSAIAQYGQATFENCTFVTGDSVVPSQGTPGAGVWAAYGANVKVIGCDFQGTAQYAGGLLPGTLNPDGYLTVTDCTGNDNWVFFGAATGTMVIDGTEYNA